MATVKAKLKWGKKQFDFDVEASGTGADLKAVLMSLTGVPVERQKVMAKGVWKGTLKDDADLSSMSFKAGQKIMLMGKAAAIPTAEREEIVFVEDLTPAEAAKVGAKLPAGFKNVGNTCYMNSTLQCLRAVPELRQALTEFTPTAGAGAGAQSGVLTATLGRSFDEIDAADESYTPFMFVAALRSAFAQFNEVDARSGVHKQQDADELYNSVLGTLARDLTKPAAGVDLAGTGNMVDALFQIEFETKLKCNESDAEPEVVQRERARKLRCNIDGGAGAAHQINHLSEGIKLGLDGGLEKRSEVLGRNATWSKKQRINRLPKYLCVQFMRFYWKLTPNNRDAAGVNCKMMRPVLFPIDNMDVYDFCSPKLQKKLKVWRDEYADRELAATAAGAGAGAAGADESKAASQAVKDESKAGADMEDDDEDLAAALAMSLEKNDADGDVKMEEDADSDALLGPGIPAKFRGMYELFAVVSHKGRSASAGHYMAWVRKKGDDWYCFDDDAVSPCKTEHVKALKGGGDWDMTYIVFYRAKA